MIVPSSADIAKAAQIIGWLPRPIYLQGEFHRDGPGAAKLRELGIIGYASLLTISRGRETRESQIQKMLRLHFVLSRERRMEARAEESRTHTEPPHESETQDSVLARLPDFTELSEKVTALQALVINQGQTILEIKANLEKLLRELGVK